MVGIFKCSGLAAASLMIAALACGSASAKSKMSYEQAFAKCKSEISANVPMSDTTTSGARYTAGAACMKKHGYRLKKGTM